MWTPDLSTLNRTRRILYTMEPTITVELVKQLRKNVNGEDKVRELLRVPRMRERLRRCERELGEAESSPEDKRPVKSVEAQKPAEWMLRFDRQKLYEEVWSEPTQQVAARYGISGAAIGKVCRCLRIPKPPRGYWAKKASGRRVNARPKLPTFGVPDPPKGRRT